MGFNEELAEKPDHGHYPVCLGRKIEIDKYCHRLFFYTLRAGLFLFALTIYTLRFSVISWIPSLFGESTEVGPYFLQFFMICCLVLLSAIGCGKYKFFNVILFMIYALMTATSLIFHTYGASEIITFFVGSCGVLMSFRSYAVYLDYRQLMKTEGFPQFNERYASQIENRNYSPTFGDRHTDPSQKMDAAASPSPSASVSDPSGEMPGLSPVAAYPDISGKVYMPEGDKVFFLSDSPIRTK